MGDYSPSPGAAVAGGQASGQIPRPVVFHASIYDGPNSVYLGPRKTDDSPQASFNYGDGKYVMLFHYTKDGKAGERANNTQSAGHVEDNKKPQAEVVRTGGPDGGGSGWELVTPSNPVPEDSGFNNPQAIASTLGIKLSSGTQNNTHNQDNKAEKSADSHMACNASAAAAAKKETAMMAVRGYPLLKAKATIEVTGVGAGSGVWYCKTVVQQWHVQHGYVTDLKLTKGKGGSGGGKSGNNQATGGSAPAGGLPK